MTSSIHSVLLNAGEVLLVLPAAALVGVSSPQGLEGPADDADTALLGTVSVDGQAMPVLAPEVILGSPFLGNHARCRIVRLRPPGTRQTVGLLVRAYPLVLSLNARAFQPCATTEPLPPDVLAQARVGLRRVVLPDLERWSQRAYAGLQGLRAAATPQRPESGARYQSP